MIRAATNTQLRVRPGDLDSLGHVNNARALEYLETARWDWVKAQDYDIAAHAASVVARITIDYQREILGPWIVVHTELAYPKLDDDGELADGGNAYKAIIDQIIFADDESTTPLISAQVQVAFIDTGDRRLITIGEYFNR